MLGIMAVTLPRPRQRERIGEDVSPPSEEEYSSTPRRSADAAPLIKCSVLMALITCPLVYTLSASLGQEPAWPLRNISQYGSHVPAVYFFRVAGIVSGTLTVQAGLLLRRRVRWALLLVPLGVCSVVSAAVSHTEDDRLHTAFAVAFFFLTGVIEGCAAHTAWVHTHHHPLFRSPGPPPRPRFWAAGSAYIFLGLTTTLCANAFGLERQVAAPGWLTPAYAQPSCPPAPTPTPTPCIGAARGDFYG